MFIGKVTGTIVATQKTPSMTGHTMFIVEPLRVSDETGNELKSTGRSFVCVDCVGAGEGETVLCVQGSSARLTEETAKLPIDAAIIGIVDAVNVKGRRVFGGDGEKQVSSPSAEPKPPAAQAAERKPAKRVAKKVARKRAAKKAAKKKRPPRKR